MKAYLQLGAPSNENRSVSVLTRRKRVEADVITRPARTLQRCALPTATSAAGAGTELIA